MPELDIEEFLRAVDIPKDTNIVFVDAGKKGVIRQGEGKEDIPTFEIKVKLPDGTEKLWTMNKTSQRTIASVFGKNTDTWKGKTVTLFTTDQNVRGIMKKVVYARTPA